MRVRFACTVLLLCAMPANADTLSDLETRKLLLERQKEVADLELLLLGVQVSIAEHRKTVAGHDKQAAQDAVATEEARRKLGAPSIVVHDARLSVAADPQRFCRATDFMRYTCHQKVDCAFTVDDSMCGMPASTTVPMVLQVNYACGTKIIDQVVPFGQRAYLTCK